MYFSDSGSEIGIGHCYKIWSSFCLPSYLNRGAKKRSSVCLPKWNPNYRFLARIWLILLPGVCVFYKERIAIWISSCLVSNQIGSFFFRYLHSTVFSKWIWWKVFKNVSSEEWRNLQNTEIVFFPCTRTLNAWITKLEGMIDKI